MPPTRACLCAAGGLTLVLALPGCAARAAPVRPAPPESGRVAPAPSLASPARLARLRTELEALFGAPPVNQAFWAVEIEVLATGERLFSLNGRKLMTPASTVKLLTLAAAADRLGWDFQFQTQLLSGAAVVDGALQGDLVVRGSGDPSIGGRDDRPARAFDDFVVCLRNNGIRTVEGRIVGDDDAFDDEGLGDGWTWEDLGNGYAAPVGALQYHENVVWLELRAGPVEGAPATIQTTPDGSGLAIVNRVRTGPAAGEVNLELRRLPGQPTLLVSGIVPIASEPIYRTASVDNPTLFFTRALRDALAGAGIEVRGGPADIDDLVEPVSAGPEGLRLLGSHRSPPLSDLARTLMKASQNLYGESLLKALGSEGASGTRERGRTVVGDVLTAWGIQTRDYVLRDGSGLSRYNLITAEALLAVLRKLYTDPRHRDRFLTSLPLAGEDEGTLRRRLQGTSAEANVWAKTGSMFGVRALAGYVRGQDDQMLAFVMIVNHFTSAPAVIDAAIDRALTKLADWGN